MAINLQEHFEIFSYYFVYEFETNILSTLNEAYSSLQGFVGNPVNGFIDYLLEQEKLDITDKISKLAKKYEKPEEKKALRGLLVRVAFELFRSYEQQFMMAEKCYGGWSQAMVELARTAVWSFLTNYKFYSEEDLYEKCILEMITFKNMAGVGFWKKCYYNDTKNFSKVINNDENMKFDGVKLFSKVGIVLEENQQLSCYKNDSMKPEKYGCRRIFSHETYDSIKNEYTDKVDWQHNYQYILDMETATKETMCEKILKEINDKDDSLMEDRLLGNVKRRIKNIVKNQKMEELFAALNGTNAATSTTTVHDNSTLNQTTVNHNPKADKMQYIVQSEFKGPVTINF